MKASISSAAALFALLPILAGAHPHHGHHHHHHHHHDADSSSSSSSIQQYRKSLNFGPSHVHAKYEVEPKEHRHHRHSKKTMTTKRSFATTTTPSHEHLDDRIDPAARDIAVQVLDDEVSKIVTTTTTTTASGQGTRTPIEGVAYYIRDDSYTDRRTGVTHIYARQLVHGLEVADGDAILNIAADGSVLSFGSSFFSAASDKAAAAHPSWDQDERGFLGSGVTQQDVQRRCEVIKAALDDHEARLTALGSIALDSAREQSNKVVATIKQAIKLVGEVVLGADWWSSSSTPPSIEHTLHALGFDADLLARRDDASALSHAVSSALSHAEQQVAILRHHVPALCPALSSELAALDAAFEQWAHPSLVEFDAAIPYRSAAKAFARVLPLLSPKPELLPRTEELVANLAPVVHRADLLRRPQDGLSAAAAPMEPAPETITGLPGIDQGGVKDGKVVARTVWHQVDDGENGTKLALTYRFEADLGDAWYEAYVHVDSLDLVAVVDWASDAPPNTKASSSSPLKGGGGKQKPLPKPTPGKSAKPYTYNVFKFGVNDPAVGNRSMEHKPWDEVASPAGWHAFSDSSNIWKGHKIPGMQTGRKGAFDDGAASNSTRNATWSLFDSTFGNNVIAHEDFEGQNNWLDNYRPRNASLVFDYEYGEPDGLRPKEYIDLAVAQLFYTSNMYHDLLHRLGFDEISGNFQMDNFGKGGRGGDAVICNAQDGSGYNNANFMTPPDGTQPRMRMYVWDTATPYRDGDLEAGIVIHEYSHGLSTRLTGGPMNSGCLGYGEAGGMGEGWGDAMATFIRQVEEWHGDKAERNASYAMGAWAANRPTGIRNYKYSTSSSVNPSTYKTLDKPGYWGVHAIGEVWAEFLFVMEELLIAEHGFSKTLFPPLDPSEPNDYYRSPSSKNVTEEGISADGKPSSPSAPLIPKHGNTLAVQLIVDGMKLQPCRPTFANARDAILQADKILTGGENECLIWQAFASRGLGPDAKLTGNLPWGGGIRTEDYTTTRQCIGKKPKKF